MHEELVGLLAKIGKQYQLEPDGPHGLAHWGRVLQNGIRLAEVYEVNDRVIRLFAIFHDACRLNDQRDPGHGNRGAALAETLLKDTPLLVPEETALLVEACRGHTSGKTAGDLIVQICWDADRLDLGRVGIQPDPGLLCTPAARNPELIHWASERARHDHHPAFIKDAWMPAFRS